MNLSPHSVTEYIQRSFDKLHVRNLPVFDFREALREPTRMLPAEEGEFEEEG